MSSWMIPPAPVSHFLNFVPRCRLLSRPSRIAGAPPHRPSELGVSLDAALSSLRIGFVPLGRARAGRRRHLVHHPVDGEGLARDLHPHVLFGPADPDVLARK